MKLIHLIVSLSLIVSPTFGYASDNSERDELEPQPLTEEEIAAAQEFGIPAEALYRVSQPMTKRARKQAEAEAEEAMQRLDTFAQKTDRSLAKIVSYAAWALKRKGYDAEAFQLEAEYNQFYVNAVYHAYMGIVPVDLGDHQPLWQWLDDWYNKIEGVLGERLCKILHIYDLKIINYAIPVVFHPKGWKGETWDQEDYKVHFAGKMISNWRFEHHGLGGVVAYWTTWGICVGATFGAGAITFICSPIGMVSEIAIDKWVAPPLSDWIYCRANGC